MLLSQGRRKRTEKGYGGPQRLEREGWLCVKSSLCNQATFRQNQRVTEVRQKCDITNGCRTKNELLSMACSPSNRLLHKHKVNVIIIVSLFASRLTLHQPENYDIS